jgi:hypothetical protein
MANNVFDEQVGLLKRGFIVAYDADADTIDVQLADASSIRGRSPQPITVSAPHSLFYTNGLFIGSKPVINTAVVIAQGSGGRHFFVSYLAESPDNLPQLLENELLIRANDYTKISLNSTDNTILIGSDNNKVNIDTDGNFITTSFNNNNAFTTASRHVTGLVKRDLVPLKDYPQNSKLDSDKYDPNLFVIALDPKATPNPSGSNSTKNPGFVESRELIYEFEYLAGVHDDYTESLIYNNQSPPNKNYTFKNRRQSRSDTLSLTLAEPNYLMEIIKGTVVDIFGNILDLNRNPLPVGTDQVTLRPESGANKFKSYLAIKELERKSIAFHFELNARKDLTGSTNTISLPDINSSKDYARNRGRFFFDIDKEGQFKMNVPASSERGNIPLLTRYENYSTFGTEDNGNPNKLIMRKDNLDIFQDSFAAPKFNISDKSYAKNPGSIQLKNGDLDGAPIDRIANSHIKHGTAYHDILATCYAHQISDFLKFQAEDFIDISRIPLLKNVATDTIKVSGPGANAGGRSGSINMDGSLELNIGANTVDRQSLWLDTAGGIVGNIGRDMKNMSAALSMNGDVFLQIGGLGVSADSRFVKQMNGHIGAVLDLRVFNSGMRVTMIRIDDEGVKIMTPSNLQIHAGQGMVISSDADIRIECETLTVQGRMVLKESGGSV